MRFDSIMKNLKTKDHLIKVPLDHTRKSGEKIEVFAREFYLPKNAKKQIFFLQSSLNQPVKENDQVSFSLITVVKLEKIAIDVTIIPKIIIEKKIIHI